ncbi:hypothetical protein E0765_10150 [Sulfuricurvum sp. IAE1]|mgnify:CR=1 FL=1|jgi:hypothetical protein|uniref:hypothetical protein n=1 Tax=Sulfuricurvum sp. IAE1 TaxID=2546102 RepID=UPI00104A47A8|nr:hypothetical protein [Sulfuricurvum sp. IAE1]MDX9965546.1 hypothetical protein [Sulfuricurvum sp.]TDA62936.1 hypothetical protein E0765_10150 [Sulfuricurvum sp. IAE1]
MRGSNFVSFITAQGFFIGIVFGIIKSESAEEFLGFVIMVSLFFYLFAHLIVGLYFQALGIKPSSFPKHSHEHNLDFFVREINKREQFIDAFYANKAELLDENPRSSS